jgi:hypothetical protein
MSMEKKTTSILHDVIELKTRPYFGVQRWNKKAAIFDIHALQHNDNKRECIIIYSNELQISQSQNQLTNLWVGCVRTCMSF